MIIADTNVILSFLLTKGITRQIITSHKDLFITPDYCYEELWRNRARWNKNNLSDKELEDIMERVKRYFISPVDRGVYKDELKRAEELIAHKQDAPILALALTIENEGIWTYNTKDFDTEKIKKHVRILGTKDVLTLHPIE